MKKTKAKKSREKESGQTTTPGGLAASRQATENAVREKGLPTGWVLTKLEEVAKWGSGGTPSRKIPKYFGGTIPWIKTGELNGSIIYETEEYLTEEGIRNSSAKIFPQGAVAIAMYGATIGKTAILGKAASTNQACAVAIPFHKVLNNFFLHYYLIQQKDNFINKGKGGAQPNISQTIIKDHPIPLPPLPEQHRIVSRLDALLARAAAARERLERVPDLLRQFRQSVLARAVSGELTREWRGHENNWEKAQLKNVCRKIQDGAHHSPKNKYADPSEGRYMYITSKNIRNNGLDLTNVEYIDEDYHQTIYPRCNPEIGDVLLTKDGVNTGNVTLNTLAKPFSLLSSVCLIKTDEQKLLPGFLMYYIQSPIGFKSITGEMTGTAIKRIVLRQIKKAEVPIPPLPEQQEIVRRVEALFAIADRIEERYEQLREQVEALPQAVLAKAFRGELVEQDAEDEPAAELLRRIGE